jgi:hypothetical protein
MLDGENPDSQSSPNMWVVAAHYIACYLLWFLICGIGLWLIFLLRRNLVEDILFMRINPWQLRAIDRGMIFFLGAVWVVSIFLLEGYLRKGVEQGKLWLRAGRILFVQLTIAGLSLLINNL